jgi:hypothetical protein
MNNKEFTPRRTRYTTLCFVHLEGEKWDTWCCCFRHQKGYVFANNNKVRWCDTAISYLLVIVEEYGYFTMLELSDIYDFCAQLLVERKRREKQ